MTFKEGKSVVYKTSNGYEIGKVKKIKDETSGEIFYHYEDEAVLIDFSLIEPLLNDYCLEDILNKEKRQWIKNTHGKLNLS